MATDADPETSSESDSHELSNDATSPDEDASSAPVAPGFVADLAEVKPIEWLSVVGGVALALGFFWLKSTVQTNAEDRLDTEYFELHSAAIAAVLSTIAVYALLTAAGWRHLAGVSGGWLSVGLKRSALLVLACVLPLAAIRASEWETPLRVLAVTLDNISGALFEEFVFRGIVLVFVAVALTRHRYGVVWAAVITALIDAFIGGGGSSIVWSFTLSLAFTALILETRSIWPAVVLHAVLNAFSDIPFDVDGMPGSSGWRTLSLVLVIVAAGFALKRLHDVTQPWSARMSANVAHQVPREQSYNPLG